MNLLAHAYLSFYDADILLGNMISDHLKGKKQFLYPKAVQAGIKLHRSIDAFTDAHPATRELKEFYRPVYRLYAGAFADVTYDYFLANDKGIFPSQQNLLAFSESTYRLLQTNQHLFPVMFAGMFPHMQTQNWLYNYHTEGGIQKSFEGMRRRSRYIKETGTAFQIFTAQKQLMKICYDAFFPDLAAHARIKLQQILQES